MWWLMMFLSTIIVAAAICVVVDGASWITLLAVAITAAVMCALINWLEKRRGNRWW